MKKKLLILCDFFLPSVKAGGPLRSMTSIIHCLKNNFDIFVATRNHELGESESYKNLEYNLLLTREDYYIIYLSSDKIVSGVRELIDQNHFDIIYFNSFFSPKITVRTLFYLKYKKIKNCRMIIAPRGELGQGALSIKQLRKKIFLFLFRYFFNFQFITWHAASESEAIDIKNVIGESACVTVLANMTSHTALEKLVNQKQAGHIKIIFLSRISKKKNLHYAIEVLSNVKGNVQFDIYGLIQDKTYWQDCLQRIKNLPTNINVTYCGECHPEKVLETLKNYDLFFLPTLNENYGYAIVEALAAGCPALLSDQTPWYDLFLHDAGWAFSLSTSEKFSEKINELILMDREKYNQYKLSALNYYTNHILDDSLEKEYKKFFCRDAIHHIPNQAV